MDIDSTTDNSQPQFREKLTYLSFVLNDELFAIEVKSVLEVLRNQTITQIPNSIEFVLGIINFRGDIVTVVDTATRLFDKSVPKNKAENIIIVCEIDIQGHTATIACTASGVKKVFQADMSQIKPAPEFGSYINLEMISGIIKENDQFIMLINSENLFRSE